jgi:hypothetical protein
MGMTVVGRILSEEQAAEVLRDPSTANDLAIDEAEGDEATDDWLSLDKAWQGVHFLLTGTVDATPEPLGQAVLGGQEVGEDDGYGPPRLMDPATVAEVATALSGLTDDEVRARFDTRTMQAMDVYPQIWDEDNVLEDYLMPFVQALRQFYARASHRGAAVLLAVQ